VKIEYYTHDIVTDVLQFEVMKLIQRVELTSYVFCLCKGLCENDKSKVTGHLYIATMHNILVPAFLQPHVKFPALTSFFLSQLRASERIVILHVGLLLTSCSAQQSEDGIC
jgi:hypothetical protein